MALATKHKAYLALTWTSIVWGSTWVVSKITIKYIPALELAYIRQFIAGSLFVLFFLLKGEKLPSWPQFRWIIGMSFLMFVFANALSTWSVKFIPSGLAALIAALYPLCVVLLEWMFFKRKAESPLTYIGLILGVGGIALVFYENGFQHQPEGYAFGISLAIFSMVAWSLGTIFVARNKFNLNPYYGMGWQMLTASFFIFLLAQITDQHIPISDIPLKAWSGLIYLVIMGSIMAFIAFIYSMKHLTPSIASLYAYINPIVAIIIGSIVLKEQLTAYIIAGSLVTLCGVYLVNYSLRKMK
jgi:drug/metabolite transporter (DMT)-like permease